MSNSLKSILCSLFVFYIAGCNYKTGLTAQSETFSIHLDVMNNSNAIQLTPILHRILKDELTTYPEIKLTGSGEQNIDYNLELIIGNYEVSPESFLSEDTLTANSMRASLGVQIKVIHQKSKNLILERNYSFLSASSQSRLFHHHNDSQLLVTLARDLSNRISRDLVLTIL